MLDPAESVVEANVYTRNETSLQNEDLKIRWFLTCVYRPYAPGQESRHAELFVQWCGALKRLNMLYCFSGSLVFELLLHAFCTCATLLLDRVELSYACMLLPVSFGQVNFITSKGRIHEAMVPP